MQDENIGTSGPLFSKDPKTPSNMVPTYLVSALATLATLYHHVTMCTMHTMHMSYSPVSAKWLLRLCCGKVLSPSFYRHPSLRFMTFVPCMLFVWGVYGFF